MKEKWKLKGLVLDEISGVDIPADPNARITLFKRGGVDTAAQTEETEPLTKGGHTMDPEELAKAMEALEVQVNDLTKRAENAEKEVADLQKAAGDFGYDIEDGKLLKRAEPEYIEVDGERIEKSAIPAAFLKAFTEQSEKIEKAAKEQEEIALAKRGSTELPNLAGTDIAKGKLLEAIGGDEELITALKAADAAMAQAGEEIGANSAQDDPSPASRLNKMAKEKAAELGVSFEIAFAEVTKSGDGARLMVEARSEAA